MLLSICIYCYYSLNKILAQNNKLYLENKNKSGYHVNPVGNNIINYSFVEIIIYNTTLTNVYEIIKIIVHYNI